LSQATTVPAFSNPFIATIYYNTVTDKGLLGEERHGIKMDGDTHTLLHHTVGVRYESGLAGTFVDTTFSIAAGVIDDEDISFSITPAQTTCNVLYKDGAADFKWLAGQTKYYYEDGGSDLNYNDGNTLTPLAANKYMAVWIFATNDTTTPIISLIGQRTDTTLADARNNNKYESLTLGTLPYQEMKLLYRVILQNTATPYVEAQDLRNISNLPAGTYVATTHNALTGLSYDLAGHTGFEPTVTKGNLTAGSTKITIGGTGTGALIGAGATVDVSEANVVHDNLSGFVADEHIAHSGVTITAGTGMSGGGTIDSTRTLTCTITQYTDALARTACIASSISDNDTTHAPDGNSVFDGLALKSPIASPTFTGTVTLPATTVIPDGGTVGQAAGPLIAFDDTNNYLEITGCNVGIGTTAPTSGLTFGSAKSTISLDTTDGSDNGILQIGGGGAVGETRGAYVNLYGNENAVVGGRFQFLAGNVATGTIDFLTGATVLRMSILNAQQIQFGGASSGAFVLSRGTADGTDDGILILAGGGAAGDTRGAYVNLFGNDNAAGTKGILQLFGGNADPGKIIFYTGGSTERMSIDYSGTIILAAGVNLELATSTGTKIGTATSQLLGFYNATPVNQPDTVADADGSLTDATTKINTIIDRLQELGLIA